MTSPNSDLSLEIIYEECDKIYRECLTEINQFTYENYIVQNHQSVEDSSPVSSYLFKLQALKFFIENQFMNKRPQTYPQSFLELIFAVRMECLQLYEAHREFASPEFLDGYVDDVRQNFLQLSQIHPKNMSLAEIHILEYCHDCLETYIDIDSVDGEPNEEHVKLLLKIEKKLISITKHYTRLKNPYEPSESDVFKVTEHGSITYEDYLLQLGRNGLPDQLPVNHHYDHWNESFWFVSIGGITNPTSGKFLSTTSTALQNIILKASPIVLAVGIVGFMTDQSRFQRPSNLPNRIAASEQNDYHSQQILSYNINGQQYNTHNNPLIAELSDQSQMFDLSSSLDFGYQNQVPGMNVLAFRKSDFTKDKIKEVLLNQGISLTDG